MIVPQINLQLKCHLLFIHFFIKACLTKWAPQCLLRSLGIICFQLNLLVSLCNEPRQRVSASLTRSLSQADFEEFMFMLPENIFNPSRDTKASLMRFRSLVVGTIATQRLSLSNRNLIISDLKLEVNLRLWHTSPQCCEVDRLSGADRVWRRLRAAVSNISEQEQGKLITHGLKRTHCCVL